MDFVLVLWVPPGEGLELLCASLELLVLALEGDVALVVGGDAAGELQVEFLRELLQAATELVVVGGEGGVALAEFGELGGGFLQAGLGVLQLDDLAP